MDYTYIGKDAPVNDSPAKAAGTMIYAGDMQLPRMLHMKLVLSPVAHGDVVAIDASAALALPGVVAVLSHENTPAVKYNRGRVRAVEEGADQETLFSKRVRFIGDRVAAVLAETPELALQAASLIKMEIAPLPAVFDVREAMKPDAVQLHEEGNVIAQTSLGYGEYDSAEGEEFVHCTRSQRLTHMAMETHCAVADYNAGRDRLTVWTPTQSVFGARSAIATILGMPMSHIRVIKSAMGGSFGGKQEMILEPLAACAAKMTGRPVKLQLNRHEVMLCTVVKHPVDSEIHVKFTPDHKIRALRLNTLLDAGGYQGVSPDYCGSLFKKLSWVYDIEHVEYNTAAVCTNTPMTGSYRGWGAPETAMIMENMMNAAARKFGMDPIELRLQNILPPYSISRINNFSLGDVRLEECMMLGKEKFGWEERKSRIAAQDRSGRYLRGIGVAISTHTSGYYPRKGDWGTVVLKMEEDGSVHVNCNVHDHGCGGPAVFQKIVAEELSISPDLVDVPEGDTQYNHLDNGCYTSRTIYVLGRAVLDAAVLLRERILLNAAEMLSCKVEELSWKDGRVYVTAEPERSKTYFDIANYVADCGKKDGLFIAHTHVPTTNPGPAAAHFAEVEVDTETGLCRLVDYLAVHDVGRALNPASCRGQVGSALQMGMGIVFCEEVKVDKKTGRTLNADLQRYHVARAYDLPDFQVEFVEHGDEEGPYGAKSIGESAYVPVAPTLIAAVNNALDMDLTTLPLDPARILKALEEKGGAC